MKLIKDKDFGKFGNFDIAVISFPSNNNLTNFILANTIEQLKPKLMARFLFNDLPVTIINKGQVTSPSIDFYHKKIKGKSYAFVIGNYRPKETDVYKKIYEIIGKSREIVILNEFTKKNGELFYIRDEHTKSRIKMDKIKTKFKKIDNAIIKGIPPIMFELAKKEKKNITILFFNTSTDYLEEGVRVLNDAIDLDYEKESLEIIEKQLKSLKKSHEINAIKTNKLNYVG